MDVTSHFRSKRAGFVVLSALLIGAFGLRIIDLGEPSVWHDEAWSIRAIRDPINTPDDNTPPVYYTALHILWQGAGETEFALRYGSVLLDLITIALATHLVRRWAGWDAAILVAILLGVSPLLWAYAREIRAYVAVPLWALVLLWQTALLLKPRDYFPWRIGLGLLCAELALLYTHNLSAPVVAWMNLVVASAWAVQHQWKWLGRWIAGQGIVLIAYLPWLLGQSPSGTPLNTPPRLELSLVWDIWQAYFAPLPALLGAENTLVLGSAVFGFVAVLSTLAALIWNRNRFSLLLLSQMLLLPMLATIELVVAKIDFHPRYYIAGVPATMMLIALGANSLPDKFEFRRVAIPAIIALACGIAAASLMSLLHEPKKPGDRNYQHDDFRTLAEYYATLPAEALIVIPYGWEPALDVYYADKVGIEAEMLGIDLHSDADTVIEEINDALNRRLDKRAGPVHVELLTWYQLPADVRGMYPCLLESAGQRAGKPFVVQGIATQGYLVEQPLTLTAIPDSATGYGAVELVKGASGGERTICVQTVWELQMPTEEDWRVSARLLTPESPRWIIAQNDTDIRRDDQALTSQWDVGDRGDAFSLLQFPWGTPPDDYVVQIGVYRRSERGVLLLPSGKASPLTTIEPVGTTCSVPETQDAVWGDEDVQLIDHDAQDGPLNPGQELRITLRWYVEGECDLERSRTQGTITLRGEDWTQSQPIIAYASYSLDWHAFRVPPEASGTATLTVEADGGEAAILATYTIEETDHLFAPPPFDHVVGTTFTAVAVLEGFSVEQTTVSPDETLELTLVWRATDTPDMSYVVFTHLLDAEGRVIAQDDHTPMNGTRPTTSWLLNEYIVDQYTLRFNTEGQGYHGPARLEVGFYHPDNWMDRVPTSYGADHVILDLEILVQ